mmetsp:Transcript_3570/g.4911  ORF Transcript_3570/g.4911 Transcript_3570/m.4911 type:complete len:210 (-) Transcript_3570:157-786(-)|eukprot:CAMPEP_0201112584 /NCGR_PEP_ID=MMETSP0812-20130820/77334_1 /ASSEMBLY_ACC=CAM_ASM_000668 /TAXON_ID=98059 /ORGANISM="Dinobryon sp., Strain UTEXLB2267" /LENGTH=209 /DNA_ID=CAMNT_0047375965 /DNA_START=66 /DNA_END=695 /DNA_ORIENTATION=+
MMQSALLLLSIASAAAFAPVSRTVSRSSLSMGIENFIGAPAETGFFDPLNLSADKDDSTLNWYRAAELKHGRVAMLATLGVVIQGLDTKIIPGFPVTNTNPFEAVKEVYYNNPGALIQIGLAIAAVEVLGASIESKGGRPGDFGWDPANIRPKTEEKLDVMQTKELKNGRLAMLSIAGMSYQTYLTGQGTIEQLASGHISPFGDGQGIF